MKLYFYILIILAAVLTTSCKDDVIINNDKLVVIIKADDYSDYSPNWQHFFSMLKENDISAGAGVITALTESNYQSIVKIRELSQLKRTDGKPLIEFWNHGYDHAGIDGKSHEFCNTNIYIQELHFKLSQKFFSDSLRFISRTFSAPFNRTNSITIHALASYPEIHTIMRYHSHEKYSIKRPWVDPNKKKVKAGDKVCLNITFQKVYNLPLNDVINYFNTDKKESYLVIQIHPLTWKEDDFTDFQKMIDFLKAKNVIFMTPEEYYEYLKR